MSSSLVPSTTSNIYLIAHNWEGNLSGYNWHPICACSQIAVHPTPSINTYRKYSVSALPLWLLSNCLKWHHLVGAKSDQDDSASITHAVKLGFNGWSIMSAFTECVSKRTGVCRSVYGRLFWLFQASVAHAISWVKSPPTNASILPHTLRST